MPALREVAAKYDKLASNIDKRTDRQSMIHIDKSNPRKDPKLVKELKAISPKLSKTLKLLLDEPPRKKKKKLGYLDQALQDMMRAASHEGVVLRHRMDRGKPIKIKTLGEEELTYIVEHILYHKALYRFLDKIIAHKDGTSLDLLRKYIQSKEKDPNENWGRIS